MRPKQVKTQEIELINNFTYHVLYFYLIILFYTIHIYYAPYNT